ncbi:MAG: 50S ribosomal protein L24 [Rhodospirillaceae bacterium]|jgi:large subunit ribosomal protein L24|nr:50S ribosomal protein L24 [Rhodospirillaceae bacterium]
MSIKVKKGDLVIVIAGKDKGKKGKILRVIPSDNRLVVQGINMLTKHTKPSKTSQGGLVKLEGTIHISNVALLEPNINKATRVGFKILEDGRKVRVSCRSGEQIDH